MYTGKPIPENDLSETQKQDRNTTSSTNNVDIDT